jgi:adenosylhomocysteine nucleosidase
MNSILQIRRIFMGKIGIIGAMEEEVLCLKSRLKISESRSVASLDFYVGELNNREVVLVRAGIGKVNAAVCTQILIDNFNVHSVINTGVAGALNEKLEIGDVVISTDAMQHDMDVSVFGHKKGIIPRLETSCFAADERLVNIAKKASEVLSMQTNVYPGRVVSGDQFVSDNDIRKWLLDEFEGFCVEMEGAAIAQACYLNRVPFVIIRSISDKANDEAEVDFSEFTQLAATNSCMMIEKMLEIM